MITTYEQEEIKDHPVVNAAILFEHILDNDVHSILFEKNIPSKGLSFKRGYFRMMHGCYVHYHLQHSVCDVAQKKIGLKLLKIQFYDSFIEWEGARVRTLQGCPPDQQWGLNLN